MPLAFSDVCVLLSRLEDIALNDPPSLSAAGEAAQLRHVTEGWFKSHRRAIDELGVGSSVVLLSTLLPERRTDRVYGVRSPSLFRILSRSLSLGAARARDLGTYVQPGRGDLAVCLERVLAAGGPPALPPVKLDEVDGLLQRLAGQCRFSDPKNRRPPLPRSLESREKAVGDVFKRLHPSEAKWLVRLVLKDFSPVRIDETSVLRSFHFLLPDLLRFQDDFEAAMRLLKGPLKEYPARPDARSEPLHRKRVAELLTATVGIKVGRPNFTKARSIDHCMKMLNGQRWVLERKYDGEYCEIHIDLAKSSNTTDCIKIFSKSGKDSSQDREGIHQILLESLQLGAQGCKFKRLAILLGELVVYSDKEHDILPFEEIRKHVARSGVFLGAGADPRPHSYEHLAIVFFDLLLLDDEVVMRRPVEERRIRLREVYRKIPGRAIGAEWKIVDFSDTNVAKKRLVEQFAASIARRCEGLILKPCGVPYFSVDPNVSERNFIKLKKDYIADMGDEADFAVVGASYDAHRAANSGIDGIRWTDFHLGCLVNKDDVHRFGLRPRFKIVKTIQHGSCIPKPVLRMANVLGHLREKVFDSTKQQCSFDIDISQSCTMNVIFEPPLVVEVLGAGFEKPSNCNFFVPRHARVNKLHEDRDWMDCISFQELQTQAAASRAAPVDSESQETRRWVAKLERKCKRKAEREQTITPRSKTATTTPTSSDNTASPPAESRQRPLKILSLPTPTRALNPATARCDAVELDVTALAEKSSMTTNKRPLCNAQEISSSPRKKPRIRTNEHVADPISTRIESDDEPSATEAVVLSDITNKTSRSSGPQAAAPSICSVTDQREGIWRKLLSIMPAKLGCSRSGLGFPTDPNPSCEGSRCLLANAVVYLAPCIATTPYIVDDLLASHNSLLVRSLTHWDRDAFAHPPLTEVVSESQAYAGLCKVVLVEARRPRAVVELVRRVMRLNDHRLKERIAVYDWRVLEDCATHRLSAEEAREHFIGATVFDESQDVTIFVSNKREVEVELIGSLR